MADLVSCENTDRDIHQALIALKKGAQLLKYGLNGKPKICTIRLSSDETTLIWLSSGREKSSKLSCVSYIIRGQRTENRDLTSTSPSPSDSSATLTRHLRSPDGSLSFQGGLSPKQTQFDNFMLYGKSNVASEI